MVSLAKGGNAVVIGQVVEVQIASHVPLDVSAALLGADGRVRSDADLVFFNQPVGPGVRLLPGQGVELDLPRVPSDVATIAILASVDPPTTFSSAGPTTATVSDETTQWIFRPDDLGPERALIAVELYRRGAGWKVRAVGQGWADGLGGLARSFGVVVDDDDPTGPPSSASGAKAGAPAAPATDPSVSPNVSGREPVELVKQGDARPVRLVKAGAAASLSQPLRINLDWARPRWGTGSDLDLGCFVEMADGGTTVIQPLGRSFGYVRKWPWIKLSGDDRTGDLKSGENLTIHRPELIKRILVFAMVYSGTDFKSVDAALTIDDGEGVTIVRLRNPTVFRKWCAVAMITPSDDGVEIRKEERYFTGHAAADQHYGFGFEWRAGYKRSR